MRAVVEFFPGARQDLTAVIRTSATRDCKAARNLVTVAKPATLGTAALVCVDKRVAGTG